MLEESNLKIRVEVSTDKVGNTRLKNLAQNSDIFIVVVNSATHSATDFIRNNRSSQKPTLYPTVKGSASILRELRKYSTN